MGNQGMQGALISLCFHVCTDYSKKNTQKTKPVDSYKVRSDMLHSFAQCLSKIWATEVPQTPLF